MTSHNSSAFLFDDVRVEPATFRAFKADDAIQLEPKTFRLLLFLIENRGRLIEKEEILENIWNGTHVTENALVREIAKLRKTLGLQMTMCASPWPTPACARVNDSPNGKSLPRLERRRPMSMQKNCSNGRVRPWLKHVSARTLPIFICCK